MKTRLTTTVAVALTCSGLAMAQDGIQEREKAQMHEKGAQQAFLPHSDFIGRDLLTKVGADEGETVDLGDVDDLVLDPKTGEISHVIVSSGGIANLGDELRAMRWDQLEWDQDDEGDIQVMVSMSEDAFDRVATIPDDDKSKFVGKGVLEASARRADRAREGGGLEGGQTGQAREATANAAQKVLLTNLADIDVFGKGSEEALASVSEFIVDCEGGRVPFATFEENDKRYIVPIEKFTVRPQEPVEPGSDEEPTMGLYLDLDQSELEGAPTIDEDANHIVADANFRKSVYEHFGVENPDMKKSKSKKGQTGSDDGDDG